MTTTQDVLCQIKGSALEKTFSGTHQLPYSKDSQPIYTKEQNPFKPPEGLAEVFIDRDQKPFEAMISYLRNYESRPAVRLVFDTLQDELYFAKELEFWGIPNDQLDEQRLVS